MSDREDGVTVINVYARGETDLGRHLSNFAHTTFPFRGLTFHSVEAWWYWRMLDKDDVYLRRQHGYAAKRYGMGVVTEEQRSRAGPPPESVLLNVYRQKVLHNPFLGDMLADSSLPFDHYYFYNGKRHDTEWRWTGLLWEKVRSSIWSDRINNNRS